MPGPWGRWIKLTDDNKYKIVGGVERKEEGCTSYRKSKVGFFREVQFRKAKSRRKEADRSG